MRKGHGEIIIQFSAPRSGSTLIYNVLRDIFPESIIRKQHNLNMDDLSFPVVATCRHPLDSIASSIQRYELTPTNDVIEQQIIEFKENGLLDLISISHLPNVLLLRYEDFVDDFEKIFIEVEKFFDVRIPLEKKHKISTEYQIECVENAVEKMGSFEEYDKVTFWHGKHISSYKGRPYYYMEYFQKDQITYLKNVYKEFLQEFKYN